MAITLNHRLYAREVRAGRQQELAAQYPGHSVIVVHVEIPGATLRTRRNNDVGYEALRVLMERFGYRPAWLEVYEQATGFEAFVVVADEPRHAKSVCCDIEREHPLGQLFSLEVVDDQGQTVERRIQAEGYRRCPVCGGDERACRRTNAHTPAEIEATVEKMHREFFHTL